ncbi:MAG: hypothetical protein ACPIOQ_29700, partial [Promethearchaeia archaeon]
ISRLEEQLFPLIGIAHTSLFSLPPAFCLVAQLSIATLKFVRPIDLSHLSQPPGVPADSALLKESRRMCKRG